MVTVLEHVSSLALVMLSSCGSPIFNALIPSLCLLTSFLTLEVQDKSLAPKDISAHVRPMESTFPLNPCGTGTVLSLCHMSFTTCIASILLIV